MGERIGNGDLVPIGSLVIAANRGKIVFEVLEVQRPDRWQMGRLRDTRPGHSGSRWKYLDGFRFYDGEIKHTTCPTCGGAGKVER
jgi:hypothetical protein